MRWALCLILFAGIAQAGPRQRHTDRQLAYFESLIRSEHLSVQAIGSMLDTYRRTGHFANPHERPSGPAQLVRQGTIARHLRTAGAPLALLLAEHRAQLVKSMEERNELRDEETSPLNFIRLEPKDTVEIGAGQHATIPFKLEGPLEVLDRHVTQGQWTSRMGSNPSHFQLGPNYPVDSVAMLRDRFLRKLDAEDPRYRHRLPTSEEWMYFASDQGTNHGQILHDFDLETVLEHAWLKANSEEAPHEVATRKPALLAGKPIYDLVGLLGDLTHHPMYKKHAMGGWFGSTGSMKREYGWQNVLIPISDPDWAFGLRVVRQPLK